MPCEDSSESHWGYASCEAVDGSQEFLLETGMKVGELAKRMGTEIRVEATGLQDEIEDVYVGSSISDLLAQVGRVEVQAPIQVGGPPWLMKKHHL